MVMKTCTKCGKNKNIQMFETRPDSRDGRRHCCRLCTKIDTKKRRKKWLANNLHQYWRLRARSLNSMGARRNGIAAKIIAKATPLTGENLRNLYERNPCCHYCKILLEKENIVFDHKIPLSRKGKHHISNMVITCKDCNQLKGTRTELEFSQFIHDYIERFMPTPR